MEDWLMAEDVFEAINGNGNTLDPHFSRNDAKARYQIKSYISKDDKERVRELKTAKAIWYNLQGKYKEKLPSIGAQYLSNLVNYQMTSETSIDEAWTQIATISRKVTETSPELKALGTPFQRLQRLLSALPQEYWTIKDSIQGQMPQTEGQIDLAIEKLQEKEAQLHSASSTAMYARQRPGQHQ